MQTCSRQNGECDSPRSLVHSDDDTEEPPPVPEVAVPQLGIPEMTDLGAVPTTPTLSADGDAPDSSAASRRRRDEPLASRVARQQQPLLRLVQSSVGQSPSVAGTHQSSSAVAASSRHTIDAALSRWISQLGGGVHMPVQPQPQVKAVIADLASLDSTATDCDAAVQAAADALLEAAALRTDGNGDRLSADEMLRGLVVSLCATAARPPTTQALMQQQRSASSGGGGSVAPQPLAAYSSPVPAGIWKAHAATRQVAARQTIRELQASKQQQEHGLGDGIISTYQATTPSMPSMPSASLAGSAGKTTAFQRPLPSLPNDRGTNAALPEGFVGFNELVRNYASPPIQGMTFGPLAGTSAGMSCGSSVASLKVNAPQHTLTAAVGEEMDDGTVDVNQYVLLQLLGRGRQGEVFLAMDSEKHELRAVKVMRRPRIKNNATAASVSSAAGVQAALLSSVTGGGSTGAPLALARDRARQQLEREISIMKKCRHRNVVTLYEVIDDPDQDCMYLVMQYVEHGTIVNLGPDGVPDRTVAPCLLAHYARQLCAGLQYLHKHGVIHRDIKPDNILLGPQDTVYLADFGMADAFDDEPETPATCACREKSHAVRGTRGTVAFMAPELVDATASTSATGEGVDVWALGVTLYTLLYGRLPWDLGAGAMDVMRQITSRPIEFPELPHVDTPPTPAAHDSCDSCDDGNLRQSSLGLAFSQDTATMSPRSRRSSDAFALTGGVATATPTPTAAGGRLQAFPSVQSPLGQHEPRPPATVAPPKAAPINIAEAWPQLLRGMLCRDPSQRLSLRSVRRRVVDLDAVYVRQRQSKALRDSVVAEEEEPITQLVRRPPQPQHHQHQLHHGMIPSQE